MGVQVPPGHTPTLEHATVGVVIAFAQVPDDA
jgi:hypothetical protein